MQTGDTYIDVAQVALYVFWFFFAGLIFYLRREDRREGYPLQRDPADTPSVRPGADIVPWIPETKTFLLPHGGTAASGAADDREHALTRAASFPGAPFEPAGDPMQAGVGPGSYAERGDEPELTLDGKPLIVPLRAATEFSVEAEDPDPRGMTVTGLDGGAAGTVCEVWIDIAEPQVRYLEVQLGGGDSPEAEGEEGAAGDRVLLPIYFTDLQPDQRVVRVPSIRSEHFAGVPRLKNPDQVTRLEEDKITGYYAAGKLYADPSRLEPLL